MNKTLPQNEGFGLHAALVLFAGLIQGWCVFYTALRAPTDTFPLLTALALPLPIYLADRLTWRCWLGTALWGIMLLLLDWGWIVNRHPMTPYTSTNGVLFLAAFAGLTLLLPSLLSWIERKTWFPLWPEIFVSLAKFFFLFFIVGFFLGLFHGIFFLGAQLLRKIGFPALWHFFEKDYYFCLATCPVAAISIFWTSRQKKLLDTLNRYVLFIFSRLLPLMALFVVAFFAVLPMGIDTLWGYGLDSSLVMAVYVCTGLLVFTAWQGGVDDKGKNIRPFPESIDIFVKGVVFLMPIFSVLLSRTIGLRVGQYGWTVDRILSMTLAFVFGLWSLAWSASLARHWKRWPSCYGRVNRIAIPLLGIVLILLVSPFGDVRRIATNRQMHRFYSFPAEGVKALDWQYVAKDLGAFGVNALKNFETPTGARELELAFDALPDGGQKEFELARLRARTALSDVARYRRYSSLASEKEKEQNRKAREGRMREEIMTLPAYGGNLSDTDRERILQIVDKTLVYYDFPDETRDRDFFLLIDLNRDGEKETLLYADSAFHLIAGDRLFRMTRAWGVQGTAGVDLKKSASEGAFETAPMPLDLLVIEGEKIQVDPSDYEEVEMALKEKKTSALVSKDAE